MRRLALLATLAIGCVSPARVAGTGSYEASWRAARDIFNEANLRLYDAVLATDLSSLDALVWGEKKLPEAENDRIVALAAKGAAWAEEAVRLRPDGVEGHLYYALNLSVGALGKSRTRAALEGLGGRIQDAYEKVIEIDPTLEAGGAYRLKGRFLMLAPWPYRNRQDALLALRQAGAIAPMPQVELFLGDLYHLLGRPRDAAVAWRRALELPSHPTTRFIDMHVKEMARKRIKLTTES